MLDLIGHAFFITQILRFKRSTSQLLPLLTLLQGLTSSATIIFYFYCIQTAGYGYAAFMLYTTIFAVIFMRIFLQRTPTKRDIIAFIIAISGIAVLTQPWTMNYSQIQGNTVLFGFLMGILSGLSSGFNSTIKVALFAQARSEKKGLQIKELLQKYPIEFNLSLATVATAFMFLIFVIPSASSFTLLTPTYWGLALLMGLLPTAIAFSLFNYGLQFDQAGDVLIFSYVESVVAGILTAVISLNLTWPLVLGGGLIIFANVIMALKKKTLK